jgi:hypothetical protein
LGEDAGNQKAKTDERDKQSEHTTLTMVCSFHVSYMIQSEQQFNAANAE